MREKMPAPIGRALRRRHAGANDLAVVDTELTGVNASIEFSSRAFSYNAPLPSRFTADGEGISPPLEWIGVPADAEAVVILVEDADSATPQPLVHAIVWDLPGTDGWLPEGALPSASHTEDAFVAAATNSMGRNSYLSARYLPPDPPPGHGAHRYVFQVFALDRVLRFDTFPGRAALLGAIRDHVIAKGMLIGTYERG